jgi:glycosyltransferase involved in cell wall biosynthesis
MIAPKISVVVPSFNQSVYLVQALDSLIAQNYDNLEILVIDGGSTDGTLAVLEQYSNHISHWVSEVDQGQTHAINKGLSKMTGEIWSYLNSDDLLTPGALHRVAELFENTAINWLGGVSEVFDQENHIGFVAPHLPEEIKEYLTPWNRQHQYVVPCSNVCFMSRKILDACGFFDETYNYSMDIEYYVRAIFKGEFKLNLISDVLGRWRWHSESKTMKQGLAFGFREDEVRIAELYLPYLDLNDQKTLFSEIQEQKRWLVTRRAAFYQRQAQYKKAWSELLTHIKGTPSLLRFRPWYGAVKSLMYDAIFNC